MKFTTRRIPFHREGGTHAMSDDPSAGRLRRAISEAWQRSSPLICFIREIYRSRVSHLASAPAGCAGRTGANTS